MTLVKNNRLGDHPDPGDTYLRHVKTTVDGSYEATSMDPNARQQIKAHSIDDGSYVVSQTEGSGETNQSSTGGVKTHFDSSTTTTQKSAADMLASSSSTSSTSSANYEQSPEAEAANKAEASSNPGDKLSDQCAGSGKLSD